MNTLEIATSLKQQQVFAAYDTELLSRYVQASLTIEPNQTPSDLKKNVLALLEKNNKAVTKAAKREQVTLEDVAKMFKEDNKPNFPDFTISTTGRAVLQDTVDNVKAVLEHKDITIKYNEMTKEPVMFFGGKQIKEENADTLQFARIEDDCDRYNFKINTNKLINKLALIAHENRYHPAVDWITSKQWDGRSRIAEFCDTFVTTETPEYRNKLLTLWLATAVAVLKFEDFSTQIVVVLQGKGGIGKTRKFNSLCPRDLRKDGISIDVKDKDSLAQATDRWLVELGEVDATISERHQASLKAFITQGQVEFRKAYARFSSKFRKQTAYFATVNKQNFLTDLTGNRRWATLQVLEFIDKKEHDLDFMQQLWAEVWEMCGDVAETSPAYPTAELTAQINKNNQKYMVIDPVVEAVQFKLNWEAPRNTWTLKSMAQIANELEINNDRKSLSQLGELLSQHGCEVKKTNKCNMRLVPPCVDADAPVFEVDENGKKIEAQLKLGEDPRVPF